MSHPAQPPISSLKKGWDIDNRSDGMGRRDWSATSSHFAILRPEQEVPIIVTLSDKIDLSLFEIVRNEKKSARRSRIVNALKEEKGTGYFLVEKISPIIRNYKNKK